MTIFKVMFRSLYTGNCGVAISTAIEEFPTKEAAEAAIRQVDKNPISNYVSSQCIRLYTI